MGKEIPDHAELRFRDFRSKQTGLRLNRQNAARAKSHFAVGKKRLLEQLRTLHKNQIIRIRMRLHKSGTADQMHVNPRIVHHLVHPRKEAGALIHDLFIALADVDMLDAGVLQQLAHESPGSAADHKNILRLRMRKSGNVRLHFIDDELVRLRKGNASIERDHLPESLAFENLQQMIIGFDGVQSLQNADGKRASRTGRARFGKIAFLENFAHNLLPFITRMAPHAENSALRRRFSEKQFLHCA